MLEGPDDYKETGLDDQKQVVITGGLWWIQTLQLVQYLSMISKLKKGGSMNNSGNPSA